MSANEHRGTAGDAAPVMGAAPAAAPDAIALRRRAVASKLAAAAFGEITALFMRSPSHGSMPVSELQWAVLPAVVNRQFSLIHVQTPDGRVNGPVGVVLWASVSPDIDARMTAAPGAPLRLSAGERRSGGIHWITDAVGSPAQVNEVISRLRRTVFRHQPVKIAVRGEDGTLSVATR